MTNVYKTVKNKKVKIKLDGFQKCVKVELKRAILRRLKCFTIRSRTSGRRVS